MSYFSHRVDLFLTIAEGTVHLDYANKQYHRRRPPSDSFRRRDRRLHRLNPRSVRPSLTLHGHLALDPPPSHRGGFLLPKVQAGAWHDHCPCQVKSRVGMIISHAKSLPTRVWSAVEQGGVLMRELLRLASLLRTPLPPF